MINANVVTALDKASDPCGVKVLRYEIKNINPPHDVLSAMEKQMRAEREKRAVILTSEGELNMDEAQKVVAFSTGKRRCAGENLARQELALMLAETYQRYEINAAPGIDIDPTACESGLTRTPKGYEMVFSIRQS